MSSHATFPSVSIGQIAQVKGGKRLPQGKVVQDEATEYPYIRVTDFRQDGLDRRNVKYIDAETQQSIRRYTITADEIYISIAGTIGLVGIVPPDLSGANLTENAAKICELDAKVDKRFLMYFLRSDLGQSRIMSKVGGVAQPKIALYRIEEIEVPLPPLPTQRKIATILSAYDDLIEVNTRRIALLEQMTRGLYREWFVRFRYPGHAGVRMVESAVGVVPEGWEVVKLGDVVELAYGKGLKADTRLPGVVPVFGSAGIVGYHNESLVSGPGIIVGRKGNVGSVFWSDVDFFPIDTVFYVQTKLELHYVFYALHDQHFINSDAAVPGLSRNQAYLNPFLVPNQDTLNAFAEFVVPIFAQTRNLRQKNANLRRTRDLLLPRLVAGAVGVDRKDMTTNLPD